VKNMHEDVITALKKGDKKLAEDVIVRDTEVNRLHWLVARQHNMISKRVKFSEKMNLDLTTAANYFLISRIIERIGDHAVRMAKNVLNLINKRVDKRIVNRIESASEFSVNIFNRSIESFFKKDLRSSNENVELVRKLEILCEEITDLVLQQKGGTAMAIGYIVESIRRTGEYSQDICENVINYIVGQEKSQLDDIVRSPMT
ncbi:MAG TPA: PhoU domain-containing protein, partial [Hadesarchaea archaeon]|nr:PhoU domain-containing protein [Hadesarchaea archaeon]